MECSTVRQLLSAFHDNELEAAARTEVQEHLTSCSTCAGEFSSMAALSNIASSITKPEPPLGLWQDIRGRIAFEKNLSTPSRSSSSVRARAISWTSGGVVLALIVSASVIVWWRSPTAHDHSIGDAAFSEFLTEFTQDPSRAVRFLPSKFASKTVDLSAAGNALGHPSILAKGLPDRCILTTTTVIEMPCCRCVQSVMHKSDGSLLVLFEHTKEERHWFNGRSLISTHCAGMPVAIADAGECLAASCQVDGTHLTFVGLKDVEELQRVLEPLAGR